MALLVAMAFFASSSWALAAKCMQINSTVRKGFVLFIILITFSKGKICPEGEIVKKRTSPVYLKMSYKSYNLSLQYERQGLFSIGHFKSLCKILLDMHP